MDSSLGRGLRGHMVVCGDNALAQRVTRELATVYGQHVTVVLPSLRGGSHGPQIAGLIDRPGMWVEAVETRVPDDDALVRAGIERASALALTSGDDQLNIYTALRARRINPRVRLVIRMFNGNLGQYLVDLLDRAARLNSPRRRGSRQTSSAEDATTTVLSDSDTAAPSIVAAAVVGSAKVLYADGLLLRAKERTLRTVDRRNPLCTLALMPATGDTENGEGASDDSESESDQEGAGDGGGDGDGAQTADDGGGARDDRSDREDRGDRGDRGEAHGNGGAPAGHGPGGSQGSHGSHGPGTAAGSVPAPGSGTAPGRAPGHAPGRAPRHRGAPGRGPVLLPDDEELSGLPPSREAVVLEAITRRPSHAAGPRSSRLPRMPAVQRLFSRRLRYSLLAMAGVVLALAAVHWVISRDSPLHAGYVTLLDLFAINEPNLEEPPAEQILQLLAGLTGMALLPLLLAVVLESYGSFRRTAALPTPPRGLGGHVVLVGLGKVGKHVLERLLELNIPVVCIEQNDEARGIALARRHRVPTLIADVTEDGVLEDAKIKRSRALLALTSNDGINLEASLNARQIKPELRVVMRLFDDSFATTVYRTLRDTYPAAQTHSRSVSALAAPAFAGAMMGRQVLGAISVGRRCWSSPPWRSGAIRCWRASRSSVPSRRRPGAWSPWTRPRRTSGSRTSRPSRTRARASWSGVCTPVTCSRRATASWSPRPGAVSAGCSRPVPHPAGRTSRAPGSTGSRTRARPDPCAGSVRGLQYREFSARRSVHSVQYAVIPYARTPLGGPPEHARGTVPRPRTRGAGADSKIVSQSLKWKIPQVS
ncbi:NAD-binding protein [Streptomyces sp. HNM0575]|uniref:NAD-binding protein n=1 Tax=Streptomyces sp. HNM0575 TaxID=2716338 RepID=UPI0032163E09